MNTTKIFNQRNNNRLQRIVMDIKELPNLDYNPKANPLSEIYNQLIKN